MGKGIKVTRTCKQCGKEFEVYACVLKYRSAEFCSRKCRGVAIRARRTCPECGQETRNRRYCSKKCAGIGKSRAFPSKPGKYGHDFNGAFRDYIWERDGRKCAVCGERLLRAYECEIMTMGKVHHIDSNKTNTTPCNCILLCNSCHTKAHHRPEWEEMLRKIAEERTEP